MGSSVTKAAASVVSTLPVSRPSLGTEELQLVGRVFESGWLGMGSTVLEFETRLGRYLGAEHVVAVNTGTSALHLALSALGIGAGDEVIVPSLTFCAGVQGIVAAGASPVFCDVSERDLMLDIADATRRITERTRAIMPVHYCGQACDMDALLAVARPRGIVVVEDAAHAIGTRYRGRLIGSFGDSTCFSFDPIKNLTCGEGGAIVVSNAAVAEELRRRRILGIDKDTWHRYRNERSWFYEVVSPGYRYHMSNINAAIGLAQLPKLEGFLQRKREIVQRYNEAFAGLDLVRTLTWDVPASAPFTYIVRVLDGQRDRAMAELAQWGVGTGIHYIPNHTQPFFQRYARGPLPTTERLGEEILTLPLYADMTDADVDRVISAIRVFGGGPA